MFLVVEEYTRRGKNVFAHYLPDGAELVLGRKGFLGGKAVVAEETEVKGKVRREGGRVEVTLGNQTFSFSGKKTLPYGNIIFHFVPRDEFLSRLHNYALGFHGDDLELLSLLHHALHHPEAQKRVPEDVRKFLRKYFSYARLSRLLEKPETERYFHAHELSFHLGLSTHDILEDAEGLFEEYKKQVYGSEVNWTNVLRGIRNLYRIGTSLP